MMKRMLIILGLLLSSWGVKAHQPDLSSTLLVEQGENTWILQMRASLTAFEYEIEKHYGESAYATAKEFQELVVKHVRENISLLFNEGYAAGLAHGMVRLGHETSLVFQVVGTPEIIHSLKVTNSSFRDIAHNQNAFLVVKEGFAKKQFIISDKNEHTINLRAVNSSFELMETEQESSFSYLWILGIGLVIISTFTYLAYKEWEAKDFRRAFAQS